MIKVVYLVSTLRRTGPIMVLANIIRYLDREKFEPIVLTLSPEPTDSMKEYFVHHLKTDVRTLGFSRLKGFLYARKSINQFLEKYNADLIHCHGFRADLLTNQLNNIAKISTVHNFPYYDYVYLYGKLIGSLMAWYHVKIIAEQPQNFVACSKSIAQQFSQKGIRLKYITNGVDTEKFFPADNDLKRKLRIKLGIPLEKKVFITVGSLIQRKDVSTVIRGFTIYNNNNKNSLLLVAGDGKERKNLERLANKSVVFLGKVSNIVEYLQASDFFISASLAEGLPNAVLEAMACGLPCVLSNISPHMELFQGEKGNFFETKNPEQLSQVLKTLSQEDYSLHRSLSLKLAREKFSAKTMSERYQKLYELFRQAS